jgi:hypothetical protein
MASSLPSDGTPKKRKRSAGKSSAGTLKLG